MFGIRITSNGIVGWIVGKDADIWLFKDKASAATELKRLKSDCLVTGIKSGVVGVAELFPGYAVLGEAGENLALMGGAGKGGVQPLVILIMEDVSVTTESGSLLFHNLKGKGTLFLLGHVPSPPFESDIITQRCVS